MESFVDTTDELVGQARVDHMFASSTTCREGDPIETSENSMCFKLPCAGHSVDPLHHHTMKPRGRCKTNATWQSHLTLRTRDHFALRDPLRAVVTESQSPNIQFTTPAGLPSANATSFCLGKLGLMDIPRFR
ncbi:hypothetical protein CLAFUW4_00447 [Fulvia fulva]|uniref:Uncharacterized protein n=1 Tax=Passalora fulva TaxID=5499 RepID=A0A9Q8L731_PASFU|nr:uncharacterized protein CLAFUR5_00449 [Fulvia fulva]KAK4636127.1 hypothetical protein CLAFUR4_00447 [Fulvia fulva]KAK4637297.1 hypothetical protein CLAFUR0_00448 [Fulvia fulva]UJO11996.1 hypothetical protein CLAFUR5_00449 [Fulvia fulva]WPV08948.1 hypothetical protein CLAFUW4_00447 [Fulvia fulva]WPV23450.1 hypothetical protein CLAFUW7_00451 [Fulvia fulva]